MVSRNRIEVLDSFRFFAILSVMLFHYYSFWFPPHFRVSICPYGNNYDYFSLGYLGVMFFFIISGFVITFTLHKTDSYSEFWAKRIIRLLPPMVLCALITWISFVLIDTNKVVPVGGGLINFIYSITFISPDLLNKVFSFTSMHGEYVDPSYWSLWAEIQFYLVASCFYFINKRKFVQNIFIFNLFLLIVNYLILRVLDNSQTTNKFNLSVTKEFISNYHFWTESVFNYIRFSLYFLMGVLFYNIYTRKNIMKTSIFLILTIVLNFYFVVNISSNNMLVALITGIMIMLFLIFSIFPEKIKFLSFRPLTVIGVSSYSLYLIHQYVGLILINKYAPSFGRFDYLFPLLVMTGMIFYCYYSYKYIEKPIGLLLKKALIKKSTF